MSLLDVLGIAFIEEWCAHINYKELKILLDSASGLHLRFMSDATIASQFTKLIKVINEISLCFVFSEGGIPVLANGCRDWGNAVKLRGL